MRLNETEQRAVHAIAKWFTESRDVIAKEWVIQQLKIDEQLYEPLMHIMEDLGAVDVVTHSGGYAAAIKPRSTALEISRDIHSQEQAPVSAPDFVDQIKQRIRSNPVLAIAILACVCLAFIIPLLNSILDLLQKFGVLSFRDADS